ncbi:MAG: TIGR04372 family glycosyltransferase [Candidatus Omnitrophica bacterium]|nr:TIGR04372 family glycosyltransferase [Candidatus Omnitrophota bacterium]
MTIKSDLTAFIPRLIKIEKKQQDFFQWRLNYLTSNRSLRIFSFIYLEIYMLLLLLLAVPGVIIIRLLRPIILVRFMLGSGKRIGHLAIDTELYLCERDAGMHKPRTYDILYFSLPFCNQQLKKMWKKKIHMSMLPRLTHQLFRLNQLLPGYEKHTVPEFSKDSRDLYGLLERIPPHLSFSAAEEKRGLEGMRKMGIPDNSPFICFHVRDSAYLKATMHSEGYSYAFRDSTISNYIPALEGLTRRNYFVIRMGAAVKDKLGTTNPKIIDYAYEYRTDFLDIYLCAKCNFFLASNSGLECVPVIFRRPIVCVNFAPFENIPTSWPVELFIFKKYWLRKEKRFMASREILDSGVRRFDRTEQFDNCDIELIENTPEEIESVLSEMDDRLKGMWQEGDEDKELQRRFWSLFRHSEQQGTNNAKVGADFLRQNKDLLRV